MDQKGTRKHTEEMEWDNRHDPKCLIETWMETYGSELKKLAFSYVKDWGKTEDIVQDVFFTCYQKIKTFRGESTVKTWLYRITVNRCKDEIKSWPFRNLYVGALKSLKKTESRSPSPEDEAVRHSENRELAEKVMALPLKYREVIILYYYSEFKTEEIADSLNQNAKTVRTRLRRARSLLREMFEEADQNGG